jgi:transcriptional antiterminator
MAAESEQLTEHLLGYIHHHYPYDLRGDPQLRADLQTHIGAMLLRVKYQIGSHNPWRTTSSSITPRLRHHPGGHL